MLYPVYKCDEFEMEQGQLTLYNAQLVAMVSSIGDFNAFTPTLDYDVIICPQFYVSKDGYKTKLVIFK